MAQETNTEPNLEKILTDGIGFLINEKIEKEQNPTKQLEDWANDYLVPIYGEEQGKSMFEIYKGDPYIAREDMQKHKSRHAKNLSKEVAKNPKTVAKEVNEEAAREVVEDMIGDNKYRALKEAVKNNNGIREIFSIQYDNADWASLVARANNDVVINYAKRELKRMTSKEYEKALYSIDEKNKTISYSPEKFTNIITANIGATSDSNKNILYKKIGLAYTKTKISNAGQKT